MIAIRAAIAPPGPCRTVGSSFTSSAPVSGWYTPASILTIVDLPAPFSPSSAWHSPAYSSIDPSTTARTAPNDLLTCLSDSTGLPACSGGLPAGGLPAGGLPAGGLPAGGLPAGGLPAVFPVPAAPCAPASGALAPPAFASSAEPTGLHLLIE